MQRRLRREQNLDTCDPGRPGGIQYFDTFDDEAGRDAHLNGDIAKALMDRADELFLDQPAIHKLDILASKPPDQV